MTAVNALVYFIPVCIWRGRQPHGKEASEPHALTRDDIEQFIRENLEQASLKSIAEKFDTNNAVIYELLSPEKPGALINRLRMEQVKQLRKANKSAKEISQITGFSEYYVRKVWNKQNS